MDENLKVQAGGIGDIETAIDKTIRSFQKLKATMDGIKSQHKNVRVNIDKRVKAMCSLVPEIKKSRPASPERVKSSRR
jgi:hypothetical protein